MNTPGIIDISPERMSTLAQELADAQQDLVDMQTEQAEVQRRYTAANNRANTLQKEFDRVMLAMRDAAPRDTDWHSSRFRLPEQKA